MQRTLSGKAKRKEGATKKKAPHLHGPQPSIKSIMDIQPPSIYLLNHDKKKTFKKIDLSTWSAFTSLYEQVNASPP